MAREMLQANWNWLQTGDEVFPEMLRAIDSARSSIGLETYIFSPSALGDKFLTALTAAARRGVEVRVLIDGLGSMNLPGTYWQPLQEAGGQTRVFNPLALHRMGIRNHRKLLVVDEELAFIGGYNIAGEYEGDGVTCGWCDVGLKIVGPLVQELRVSFDEMFSRADFLHKPFTRLRKFKGRRIVRTPSEQLLLSGPGRGFNPIKRALRRDLARARQVEIIVAYFLPTWRLRRDLIRVVRNGGRVRLILAGKSDVTLSQLAAKSLYRRLLRSGLEIHEYQPQILHAKMVIIDDIVYIGSANLDQRSLNINYELMVRFENGQMAEEARAFFAKNLQHSQQVTLESWRRARSLWSRLKQHWAYFILVRVDPYIARSQWRALPD